MSAPQITPLPFKVRYEKGLTAEAAILAYFARKGYQTRKLAKDTTAEYLSELTAEERRLPDYEIQLSPTRWVPLELKSTPLVNWAAFQHYPPWTIIAWFNTPTKIKSNFVKNAPFRGPFQSTERGSKTPFIILL
jgi:hypothetical protein